MLLNSVEKALMNNPVRALLQRHFEARRLLEMGGPLHGGRALEIGCGRGVGTELLFELFGASEVDAFDLDPHMIALARRRLASRGGRVKLSVGDAEHIDARDGAYDAVFDFAIIHHIPNWRAAVREVHRVLRPGGRFYAEEVLRAFIHHPFWRRVLEHPMYDRFDSGEFARALEDVGFRIVATKTLHGQFGWFVADRL